MLKNLPQRIVFLALAVVLLCWGGYHAYQYYNATLQLEAALEYSVTRTIAGEGIAIRTERLIEESVNGTGSYLYDNASRVAVGDTIAEYYVSDAGDQNVRRMRELQAEMDMLRSAQDTNVNNYANADVINREIRDRLGTMSLISSTGRCTNLTTIRSDLTSLINRRQVATGKTDGFQDRISTLMAEYQSLNVQTSGEILHAVKAPVPGYFSRAVDGFETNLSPTRLSNMSIADYLTLMDSTPTNVPSVVGKMVTSQEWYLAVAVPVHQTEWIAIGQTLNIELEGSASTVPAVVSDLKLENNVEQAIVLLRCNYMTEALIDLRVVDVKLHSTRYTGLRVNTDAIRFVDGIRGVYVLEDNMVRFRTLRPLYEEQSYLISDMSATAIEDEEFRPVKLYDQIIIKGIDLYDGKPVQ